MKQLTVKQLYANLAKAMVRDPNIANKIIIVSDDTEGNSFHGLWFGLTTDTKDIRECIELSNGVSDTDSDNPNDIVILG